MAEQLQNRLTFISAIRGAAALLVAIFHLQIHVFAGFPQRPIRPHGLTWWVFLGFFDLGKYAVALFFLVSGFLIPTTLRHTGIALFLKRRLLRLYPAYWSAIALQLAALALLGASALDTRAVLVNLTMLQRFLGFPDLVGVFWTLQIELVFYAICVVLAARGWLDKDRLWMLLSLLAAAATAAARAATGIKLPLALTLALALMFFADGLRRRPDMRLDRATIVTAVLLSLAITGIALIGYGTAGPRYAVTYAAAIGTFLLCRSGAAGFARGLPSRLSEFLGDISYSLYLTAATIMELVARPLFALTGSAWLTSLCFFPIAIGFAALLYTRVEAPCIRLGHRTALAARAAPARCLRRLPGGARED